MHVLGLFLTNTNAFRRDDRLNRELDYWLTKELELMKMRDHSGESVQEIKEEPKEEPKHEPRDQLKDDLKDEPKKECRCICKCKGMFKKKSKDE